MPSMLPIAADKALRPFASIADALPPDTPDSWELLVSSDGEAVATVLLGECRAARDALAVNPLAHEGAK